MPNRLAVISDVHGNLPALEAVLKDIADRGGVDQYVMLGDYAAMNAWPGECVTRLRTLPNCLHVRGNTDRYALSENASGDPAKPHPLQAVFNWTRARLDADDRAFLRDLPVSHTIDVGAHRLIATHSTLDSDERSVNQATPDAELVELFKGDSATMLLTGHTHVQYARRLGATGKQIINPGSVGVPFDGDQRAAYAMVAADEVGNLTVRLRRVAYDVEAAISGVRAAGCPSEPLIVPRLRQAAPV